MYLLSLKKSRLHVSLIAEYRISNIYGNFECFRFSFFHLEYQPTTGRGLTNLLAKHYRNQALFQLHTIIFGLDALGNPVSVVRGVVGGAVDLFYEPIKVNNIMTLYNN